MRKKPDVSAAEHIENILILIERSESILNLQRPFGKVNLSERRQIQNQALSKLRDLLVDEAGFANE